MDQKGVISLVILALLALLVVGILGYRAATITNHEGDKSQPSFSLAPTETLSPLPSQVVPKNNISPTNQPMTIPATLTSTPPTTPTNSSSNNQTPNSTNTSTPNPTNTPAPTDTMTPTPTAIPTKAPTINTNQGITVSEYCSGTTLNASVYGDITAPSDRNNGLWSTLTDSKAGQTMIYEYDGNQGQPTIHISANFPQTGAIRGSSVSVVGDGRVYVINVYAAPYNSGTPSLGNSVATNSFSLTCK